MIELKNVYKYYNDKKVVDDLSLTIEQGELFGFLGPNGAGKTTTIRMIIGLLKPTQGEIWVNGHNVLTEKKKVHRDIGVVFELPNLYVRSSIKKNLKLFGDLYGVSDSQVNKVMEDLQLSSQQDVKVGTLSKGWKQRVLIARAMLHKPKIVILDEPTSGLDPNTAALIRNYIKELNNQGTTVILTTHDMHDADELSTRVGIMYNGKLAAIDKPENLKSKYCKKEVYIEYMKEDKLVKESLPMGTDETEKKIAQLMSDDKIVSMKKGENSLAEVFATITGRELS
ncbi:ABC transporter ATP-binding protein [Clostridium sp. BNL1100]|uniref:ABC transporter ATP-binding protein n=1 Tax=Clostridium sp. BNL1100 TaxID=755731 RepID=UPI00024A72F6|nr:ABC transporter ATP-binding protein [Clostridium sp. BNL1100]AEY67247.1 ABC-type multidrug transport system, ATPase component [Clostridium sp. BNL1100]